MSVTTTSTGYDNSAALRAVESQLRSTESELRQVSLRLDAIERKAEHNQEMMKQHIRLSELKLENKMFVACYILGYIILFMVIFGAILIAKR